MLRRLFSLLLTTLFTVAGCASVGAPEEGADSLDSSASPSPSVFLPVLPGATVPPLPTGMTVATKVAGFMNNAAYDPVKDVVYVPVAADDPADNELEA